MKSIQKILEIEKKKISPDAVVLKELKTKLDDFLVKLNKEIKQGKIGAEYFVGGSFAKGTVIKKEKYEIDLFLRFDKKYSEEVSSISENLIKRITKNYVKIHGSRDYFQIHLGENIILELVPVVKISKPKDAENVIDSSYFHVNYVKKELKRNKKLADEIKIAKAFAYAQNCYGAESYIQGFSGYALELLIIYYGSFEKFLKELVKAKGKIIIFNKKDFKNKNEVMLNLNSSKLSSPIVLIDPTFKERNALAALSQETFDKFKSASKEFLKNPSEKFFVKKDVDFDKIKMNALKNKKDFVIVELETDKQEGDIAGSKMLKFYKLLNAELERYFKIKDTDFSYNGSKTSKFYIIAEGKKELLLRGPPVKLENHAAQFKRQHKNAFVKGKNLFAKQKQELKLKDFLRVWRDKNSGKLEEMYVKDMKIFD